MRAAVRLDTSAATAIIRAALDASGVVSTWDGMLRPVLARVAARHAATGRMVEVEHLLSASISGAFSTLRHFGGEPAQILLACAEDEQHSLPLEALAAALAERGQPTRYLGARLPSSALQRAVRRSAPDVVFVWSHALATAHRAALLAVLQLRPPPAVVAAVGPGWPRFGLPATVEHPASLGDAVALSLRAHGSCSP